MRYIIGVGARAAAAFRVAGQTEPGVVDRVVMLGGASLNAGAIGVLVVDAADTVLGPCTKPNVRWAGGSARAGSLLPAPVQP